MDNRKHLEQEDPDAASDFTGLVQPYLPLLRRLALRLTRRPADAEDLLQDVLLKLYRYRESVRRVQALKPWLIRAMYYHSVDRRRRAAPEAGFVSLQSAAAPADDDASECGNAWEPADQSPGPEDATQQAQLAESLARALQRLPDKQSSLVRMHEIEGLTVPEIAARTGIPLNSVKSSLKRARADLGRRVRHATDGNRGRTEVGLGHRAGR